MVELKTGITLKFPSNNLSKCLSPRDMLKESADNCRKNGCWRVNGNYQPVNGVNDGILLAFDALGDGNIVYQQLFNNLGSALYVRKYWFNGWSAWVDIALKSDLFGRSINVASDGGTQNFNIGNNGFLFIPYTSTTFGIYYIGRNSAKLILGTEDSDFKVSISGTTCMLQNNKGWNIFCVFIEGQ